MKTRNIRNFLIVAILMFFLAGCGESQKSKKQKISQPPPPQFDRTIGDLAEVVAFNPIPVKGIGLVVGLAGTGSAGCLLTSGITCANTSWLKSASKKPSILI